MNALEKWHVAILTGLCNAKGTAHFRWNHVKTKPNGVNRRPRWILNTSTSQWCHLNLTATQESDPSANSSIIRDHCPTDRWWDDRHDKGSLRRDLWVTDLHTLDTPSYITQPQHWHITLYNRWPEMSSHPEILGHCNSKIKLSFFPITCSVKLPCVKLRYILSCHTRYC